MDLNIGFGTPWQAQIDFLLAKLRLPTERWDDIQKSAHDRAFIVAGAAKADLLADLQQAVVDNASKGTAAFARDFKAIVAKHGWTGWTGEGSPEGEAWRARVIYQTNMSTSYAAARYQQLKSPAFLAGAPFWRYIHSDSVMHPRPYHLAWHGLTLPHDHPFWDTHFAPNGWGCQCRITAVSQQQGEASARAGLGEPPEGWKTIDPKTGAPVGIDKGFDYAPGANTQTPLRQFVQDKLVTYPDAIATVLSRDVTRYVNATTPVAQFVAEALADASKTDPLWLGFVERFEDASAALGMDVKGYTIMLPRDAVRHIDDEHGNDTGKQRPPRADDFALIAQILNEADSIAPGSNKWGGDRLVAEKVINGETFNAVFEARPGKKNRALALVTYFIKTSVK